MNGGSLRSQSSNSSTYRVVFTTNIVLRIDGIPTVTFMVSNLICLRGDTSCAYTYNAKVHKTILDTYARMQYILPHFTFDTLS